MGVDDSGLGVDGSGLGVYFCLVRSLNYKNSLPAKQSRKERSLLNTIFSD
ncbi:hypothetical protein [Nostoc sp. PA-18-2419]|nr:hypothetical protein [Nostoc sp. PA-18-2419]